MDEFNTHQPNGLCSQEPMPPKNIAKAMFVSVLIDAAMCAERAKEAFMFEDNGSGNGLMEGIGFSLILYSNRITKQSDENCFEFNTLYNTSLESEGIGLPPQNKIFPFVSDTAALDRCGFHPRNNISYEQIAPSEAINPSSGTTSNASDQVNAVPA